MNVLEIIVYNITYGRNLNNSNNGSSLIGRNTFISKERQQKACNTAKYKYTDQSWEFHIGGNSMKKEITLNDENLENLKNYKRIFEAIMEEEIEFNEYVNAVISIALDKMVRDAIPQEHEWATIQSAFHENYEFMSKLVADIWKKGKDVTEKEKQEVKERISQYIQ